MPPLHRTSDVSRCKYVEKISVPVWRTKCTGGGMIPTPKRSAIISGLVHAAVIVFLVLISGVVKTPLISDKPTIVILPSDLVKYQVTHTASSGGSGGGEHDKLPPR